MLCCAVLCCVPQTRDQPELTIPSPEVCQHLGPQLVGAAAVVLSQLLASYIEGVDENTFLTADSSVFSSSAGGWVWVVVIKLSSQSSCGGGGGGQRRGWRGGVTAGPLICCLFMPHTCAHSSRRSLIWVECS